MRILIITLLSVITTGLYAQFELPKELIEPADGPDSVLMSQINGVLDYVSKRDVSSPISDIFYVSSTYGNDTLAQQGVQERSYKNLRIANINASGQYVEVLPGSYLMANDASAPLLPNENVNLSGLNMINIQGTLEMQDTSSFAGDMVFLSAAPDSSSSIVLSIDSIYIRNTPGNTVRFSNLSGEHDLYLKARSLDFLSATGTYSAFTSITSNSIIDIDNVSVGATDFVTMFRSSTRESIVNIGIDNLLMLDEGGGVSSFNKRAFYIYGQNKDLVNIQDSLIFNVNIKNLNTNNLETGDVFAFFPENGRALQNSKVSFNITSHVDRLVNTNNNQYSPSSGLSATYSGVFEFKGSQIRGTDIIINVDDVDSKSVSYVYFTSVGSAPRLDSSSLKITLQKGTFRNGPILGSRNTPTKNFANNTNVILDCKECLLIDSAIVADLRSWDIDASSKVIISGDYRTSSALPLIITEDDIYLHNVKLENDGTVPLVKSTVPVTVYVSGAFYIGNSPLDPNITFVRLNELGFNQAVEEAINIPVITNFTAETANFTATLGESHLVDVSGGNVIVTAPGSPSQGDAFQIVLVNNTNLSGNNCTINMDADGYGDAATLPDASHILNTPMANATFTYTGSTWVKTNG